MANSRDFTGKNRKFTGTKGVVMPKGSTAERADTESGEIRFNTTTELMEYYDGNQWKPIDAPPTISSISTSDATGDTDVLNADGSTLFTITINGGNFSIGPDVKFIGNTGTEYTAGNINRVSNSQITCTTLLSMGTSDDPYDVQVINTSGLSATLDDALSFNAPPVFTVASGTLGEVYNGQTISGTTLNAGATDAEGNTITFSIISGSLPGSGLTLSSSTGAITGTLSGTPSLGNYPFVVQAATTEGTVNRQFSIQVIANPFVVATGGTITTDGDDKIHTFNNSSNFVVSNAGTSPNNAVQYLVIGGGGGGGAGQASDGNHCSGGGGGAGGVLYNNAKDFTVTAQTYSITVGGGGAGGSGQARGTNGSSATFSNITSAGGGGGGSANTETGLAGGSGGGAGNDFDSGVVSGGAGNTPATSPSQGNNGGGSNGGAGGNYGSGGGGGAGAAGTNGATNAGAGGNGVQLSISGSSVYYGGGGGAGVYSNAGASAGGLGGGGNASNGTANGGNGTDNLGGGGGGVSNLINNSLTGGTGGKGVVIIRYKYQ
jgi:hypothetical protein